MERKKIVIVISMIVGVVIFLGCKKNKEDAPLVAAPTAKRTTAKVNGVDFATNDYSAAGNYGQYNWGAYSNSGNPAISLNGRTITGTYVIDDSGSFSASYRVSNTLIYTAKSGSITVTEIDSTMTKFKASFNFSTDTISGLYYNVTDGVVNKNL